MIAGLLVRGYKVYNNVKFIPFFELIHENLKLFIGPNGVGKSSILESLDIFFNNAKWKQQVERTDGYVAPLLLIDRNKINKFSETSVEYLQKISNFLWNENYEDDKLHYSYISDFFTFRDRIKPLYEKSHYLILLGIASSSIPFKKDFSFATFDSKIKRQILGFLVADDEDGRLKLKDQNSLIKLLNEIQETFTYIYIPTETNITEYLRLESNDMQKLTDKKIVENIDNILNSKIIKSEVSAGEVTSQETQNILELINEKLQLNFNEIESTIQKIDSRYRFQEEGSPKLTAKDINRQIIKAFYTKRILKFDSKPIESLSSGERKKALIDIAYSFLGQEKRQQEKEVILAIDEPEASLDMSIRYEQFDRIEKLAKICQVLVATHWYGSLPILQDGLINHIEKDDKGIPKIRLYKVHNYFEDRKDDPDDIYFKSFSDLSLSILTSLKNKNINWIIVEGPEDKNYLDYYLKDMIKDLRILPVGGCGSVGVLYQHLFISISRRSDSSSLKGKVFCLVDTDSQIMDIEKSDTKNEKLRIRRFHTQIVNKHKEVQLAKINARIVNPTEIEDVLNPQQFYNALKTSISNSIDMKVREAFECFTFDPKETLSFIGGENSILVPQPKEGRNSKEDKQVIIDFIDKNKHLISEEYCKLEQVEVPLWVREIIGYFAGDIKNNSESDDRKIIRLSKVAIELNISTESIIEFLNGHGFSIS